MARKEWARSDVEELISDYVSRPVLRGINTTEYRNRCRKHDALKELAEKYKTEIQEVKRKIHNLHNQFNSEFKKSQKNKSGQGTDEKCVSKGPHYQDSQLTDTLDNETKTLNDDDQDNAAVLSYVKETRRVKMEHIYSHPTCQKEKSYTYRQAFYDDRKGI
ncbi:hypothetical protein PR048_009088 [Dryococelus australis]|uniref:MADF domain-containing protein n=1 Tax=Dryococelus australis TaxID=614101 RepID=A0ABQ9HYX7_9NEOP|nr:hypothetical protein PR048_009088 [Dryococelus australis]